MARIILHPGRAADIGIAVGTLEGQVLSFVDKAPYVAGRPIEYADIGYDVSIAVEEAAIVVFGQEWSTDLGRVTGLNRRTVTRDRIERFGVAVWVYEMLGRAATSQCPRATGYMLLAAAEFCDRGSYTRGASKRGADFYQRGRLRPVVEEAMTKAWLEVDEARYQREKHELSKNSEMDQ